MKRKNIIKIVILAIVLVLLLNPDIFPFAADTIGAISAQITRHIGDVIGGTAGIFSLPSLIPCLAIIVLMWLINTIVNLLIDLLHPRTARVRTVVGLAHSVTRFICALIAIIWALSVLGVNITAIFASLGILTLILGFGAQSLIEDMVTGLFILCEGNYNVDDVIVLDDFRGTVRKIGIRTTTIEDGGGNLKIVNNSDIRNIQNRSRNLSRAICDIGITYEADIRKVEKVILPLLPELQLKNPVIFEGAPRYLGVQALADSSVVLRFCVDCKEENFFSATRALNREMKILFDDNGIDIPFPQIDVHQK